MADYPYDGTKIIDGPEDDPDVKGDAGEPVLGPDVNLDVIDAKVPESPKPVAKQVALRDRLWANRFNLVRHFLLAGCTAAITAFTTTKDWAATGGAFVIGGVAGIVRKGGDDELRAAGKPDMLTAAANLLKPRTNGKEVGMIREDATQLGMALAKLVTRLTDDKPNKDEIQGILTDAFGLVTEGTDFAAMPKEDRVKAGIHALTVAAVMVAGEEIKYSDEATPA